MNARDIIVKENILRLASTGKHEEVIKILHKYPDQRADILIELIKQRLT